MVLAWILALQAAGGSEGAVTWRSFPWSVVITLVTLLTGLAVAALHNRFRAYFFSIQDADKMRQSIDAQITAAKETALREIASLREKEADHHTDMKSRLDLVENAAEEAFRKSELTERSMGEQWSRVTEMLVAPLSELAKEQRQMKDLLIRSLADGENLKREVDSLRSDFKDLRRREER